MSLEWMAWTLPTAIFFGCIATTLICMGTWEILVPSVERKGFLPITTSRGDRLFIGLLSGAFIHLLWIGLVTLPLWWALAITVIWIIVVQKWG